MTVPEHACFICNNQKESKIVEAEWEYNGLYLCNFHVLERVWANPKANPDWLHTLYPYEYPSGLMFNVVAKPFKD